MGKTEYSEEGFASDLEKTEVVKVVSYDFSLKKILRKGIVICMDLYVRKLVIVLALI